MITPFSADGSINFGALPKLVEHLLAHHTDALLLAGTTAESPTLTHDEELELFAAVQKIVNGRVPLIAGIGTNDTRDSIEFAREVAVFGGFAAGLAIVPYYNKPSQEGLYHHFMAIANASPVPVILYNVPGRVGVNMTAATTLRLANDNENIIAIKEASGNFDQIDDIIKNKPARFNVLSGDDGITFPLITLGATGVISVIGNAFPKEFSRMVRLARAGEYDTAREIHHRFKELFSLLFIDGNPAGVKAMLNSMGFCENVLRLPLVPTRITTFEKIQDIVRRLPY